ncbi:MAG: DEAD/DEAH box helicase family protein [Clostridiales bacterium]|nr:DEAD/DEAH box helicase family protein [Clostridiales bacterium]
MITLLLGQRRKTQVVALFKRCFHRKPLPVDLLTYALHEQGASLFKGQSKQVIGLRHCILAQLEPALIDDLFKRHGNGKDDISITRKINALEKLNWAKKWRNAFSDAISLPESLTTAGGSGDSEKPKNFVDVQPNFKLPDLVDFQLSLKERLKDILEQNGDKTRCIVTLPTGSGKTRVAMQAFIEFIQPRFAQGHYLVWVAQSEELCEQAISCLQTLWSNLVFSHSLRIYRFFGSHNLDNDALHGGAVVTCINKIYNSISEGHDESKYALSQEVLSKTSAMIFDEAHRCTTAMYDTLLNEVRKLRGPEMFPICGLTATPGRSQSDEETMRLVNLFQAELIMPELEAEYQQNPLAYFQEKGYLSRLHHIRYESGIEYKLTDDELQKIEENQCIPNESALLKHLANDQARNELIISRLMEIPAQNQTLVYTCGVDHAKMLAAMLNLHGRVSAWVSASTSDTDRREMIARFKRGELEFLFNYGVLTTGFDAPKTSYIVICRPTASTVLYEQIIGRGLRGPLFGGTDNCTVIDFTDNILRLKTPKAYTRFSDFWNEPEQVESASTASKGGR